MPFGRKSPLEALALPGVILAYKYSQFRQRRREAASRRVTERELSALHYKIDKLLSKLEESEPEPPTSQEDECVICINARATMQTSPCGHRVVCRRCFVKTIQSAVAQRLLPLRCVICRARVNRLTSSSGTWRIQESASSYSVGGKSWSSVGVSQSASSYSMGVETNHHQQHNPHPRHNSHSRVTQSASLYSMSSGSSYISSNSNATSCSQTSSGSSGIESSSGTSAASGSLHHSHHTLKDRHHPHQHHASCGNGCLGAIPRRPSMVPTSAIANNSLNNTYPGRRYAKGRISDLQNRLPPIKEFRSPAKVLTTSPVHISNPRLRYGSYTKSSSPNEMAPLLNDPYPSPTRKPPLASLSSSLHSVKQPTKLGMTSKVGPTASRIPTQKIGNLVNSNAELNHPSSSNKKNIPLISISNHKHSHSNISNVSKSSSTRMLIPPHQQDEKADNKKNETMEKRKKDEKLKIKSEKEARKEEKRIAKEEERLAKQLAKEEKKKGKRDKELLLVNDGK